MDKTQTCSDFIEILLNIRDSAIRQFCSSYLNIFILIIYYSTSLTNISYVLISLPMLILQRFTYCPLKAITEYLLLTYSCYTALLTQAL
jgi:hypothetical protein